VPYFQEQFAVTCTNLSHVLHELGRNQEAKGRLEAALAVLRDLQQQDPKLQYHYHFALSLLARGQVLSGLGLDTEAEGDFRSATEILETLIGRQADEGWRCDLAITRSNWARLLHKLERFDDAEAMFRAAIQDFEVLSEHVRRMPAVKDCTAWSYDYFGDLLFDAGKRQDAERAYRRALQAWEAAQQTAGSPAYQHHLAWFLANCPVRSLRDPQRAVDLANQAKNQTPENAAYWNTLGVANYRSAQYEASLAALREAQKHRPDGNSLDWFFLAMAYGRLGDVEMSRQCYEQGTQWMTRHTPGDFRLRKIRVEAEQLIESPPNPETGPANDEP
jgi:tetratricopeptide (TPR) repeat protein